MWSDLKIRVPVWVGIIFRYKATDSSSTAKSLESRPSVVVVSGQEPSFSTSLFFSSYCFSSASVITRPNPFPWTWHSGTPKGHNTFMAHVYLPPANPLWTSLFRLTIAAHRKPETISGCLQYGQNVWAQFNIRLYTLPWNPVII